MSVPCKAIVVWGFHDLVSTLREIAGYKDYNADPNLDEGQVWLDYVNSLDPKDWKEHDLYAILGLKKLRFRASDAQIKNAYRRLILEHHPDKNPGMHIVFCCIQKAYAMLSEPDKRKAYDSVDPQNKDEIPTLEELKNGDFYNILGPVFYENSKWSRRQPVPQLGSDNTPIERVDQFYRFWFDFDTWREFSFLDKEETEDGANRDERRYVERLNKVERAEKRREELRRIRQLVELANTNDPRIKRHQQQVKEAKLQKKQEKQAAIRRIREAEEEQRRVEQQRIDAERQQAEAEQKRIAEEKRKEREVVKARLKRERKQLRSLMQSQYNFFCDVISSAGDAVSASKSAASKQGVMSKDERRVLHMHHVDLLCNNLEAEDMEQLNAQLAATSSLKVEEKCAAFLGYVKKVHDALEQAKLEVLNAHQQSSAGAKSGEGGESSTKWNPEMTQCLVKAFNLIPAGSVNRWEAVAQYIMTHCPSSTVLTGKDVLKRVNAMKQNEGKLKSEAQQQAQSALLQPEKLADAVKSVKITERCEVMDGVKPWTTDEQKRLEEALRKFPASESERWDKISDYMGDRTKKECMQRYKTVVEMLKSKKAAAATPTPSTATTAQARK